MLANGFRETLLTWYDTVKAERSMPWRVDFDPLWTTAQRSQRAYEVLVSEIMLQQTQVNTVKPYYNRWIARWPSVVDLGRASVDVSMQCLPAIYDHANELIRM